MEVIEISNGLVEKDFKIELPNCVSSFDNNFETPLHQGLVSIMYCFKDRSIVPFRQVLWSIF